MSPKDPRTPPSPSAPSREERLAKALRDNLARRKALARAKRARDGADTAPAAPPGLGAAGGPREDDAPS